MGHLNKCKKIAFDKSPGEQVKNIPTQHCHVAVKHIDTDNKFMDETKLSATHKTVHYNCTILRLNFV